MISDHLKHKLELLPVSPGCYLMKDEKGEILYVGKAKVLKNRVRSYFHGVHNNKTTKLVSKIADFETVQTKTEKEALLLEINLIKKYRPPFNIMFMDDKQYPYIEVSQGDDFTVRIARKVTNKKNDYFGPYPISTYAYDMVKLINRLYPIRKCRSGRNLCLYYHMHQCLGYCVNEKAKEQNKELREKIIRFLKGDADLLLNELQSQMDAAVEALRFERAAEIHEEMKSIRYIQEKQIIDYKKDEEFDVFGWYEDKGYISFQGFFVREGKLLDRNMAIEPIYEEPNEAFISFILQYYQSNKIPKTIYVPDGTPLEILQEALNTKVKVAKAREKKQLADLALHNAKEAHSQQFELLYRKASQLEKANEKLNELFNKEIHTVELFDNSHLSGTNNVSGLVVFKDGKPDKRQYRKFKLKENLSDIDSMKEAIYRRYFRLLKEKKPFPDLLLVDGGMQQIEAAKEIKSQLNLPLTIAGLVKDDKHTTRALLDENLKELPLDKQDPLFFLLTRMQDEVHRFAITYHQSLRNKKMTKSIVDDVPGIGPKRKEQLQKAFPSLKKLKQATLTELGTIIPLKEAKMLYAKLHQEISPNELESKENEAKENQKTSKKARKEQKKSNSAKKESPKEQKELENKEKQIKEEENQKNQKQADSRMKEQQAGSVSLVKPEKQKENSAATG